MTPSERQRFWMAAARQNASNARYFAGMAVKHGGHWHDEARVAAKTAVRYLRWARECGGRDST